MSYPVDPWGQCNGIEDLLYRCGSIFGMTLHSMNGLYRSVACEHENYQKALKHLEQFGASSKRSLVLCDRLELTEQKLVSISRINNENCAKNQELIHQIDAAQRKIFALSSDLNTNQCKVTKLQDELKISHRALDEANRACGEKIKLAVGKSERALDFDSTNTDSTNTEGPLVVNVSENARDENLTLLPTESHDGPSSLELLDPAYHSPKSNSFENVQRRSPTSKGTHYNTHLKDQGLDY
jgi:TolA-binding protein